MQLLRGNNPGRTPYALRFAGPIDSEFQNVSGNRGRVHASTHCRPKLVTYGRAGRQAAALPGGPPRPKPYRHWTRHTAPIRQMLASCESFTFFNGNSRTRLPLAAKMALAIAGAMVAVPHSPMPPHFLPPDGTR